MFVQFSVSILGKLFAVLIIIVYICYDILTGVFICLLVIVYYQTVFLEGMDNYQTYTNRKQFEKMFCVADKNQPNTKKLEYKGQPVRISNIPYIFPQLKFTNANETENATENGEPCDPCSPTCSFAIFHPSSKNSTDKKKTSTS